jgi:aspartyl-tRNA(Asn)/glutamyl-tRNA(Gln) amidotransferase subunit A
LTVADAALLLGVIAGHDERDSTSVDMPVADYYKGLKKDLKGLKIGLPQEYFGAGLDSDVETAVRCACGQLAATGAMLNEGVSLPHTDYAIATYYIVATAEASSNLARYDGIHYGKRAAGAKTLADVYKKSRREGFGNEVIRRIILGTYVLSSGYYDAYYLKALKVRTLIKQDFDKAFEKVDALITPTSPTTAFKIGEKTSDPLQMYLSDIFTVSINLAGIPGISIPCGFSKNNLPIGMQILAKPFGEETLIKVANAYQRETDFHKQKPKICGQ